MAEGMPTAAQTVHCIYPPGIFKSSQTDNFPPWRAPLRSPPECKAILHAGEQKTGDASSTTTNQQDNGISEDNATEVRITQDRREKPDPAYPGALTFSVPIVTVTSTKRPSRVTM